jgi:hypothetical protein
MMRKAVLGVLVLVHLAAGVVFVRAQGDKDRRATGALARARGTRSTRQRRPSGAHSGCRVWET